MANFNWPVNSSTVTATNPSVGITGITAPTSATEVGGIDPSGNLKSIQTDAAGNLLVSLAADPIDPLGVNLTEVGGAGVSLGQKTSVASIPVVVASDQSTLPISAASLPLPAGAATAALQTSGNTLLTTIASNQTNGTQVTAINNFPATQPVSGTVTVVQPTGSNLHVQVDASALPSGAATAALQTSGNATLTSIDAGIPAALGQTTASASMPVVLASDQTVIPIATVDLIPSAQNITVVDSGSSTVTGFNNQPLITGTPTAGSAASFAVSSKESVAFEIKGTWTGSLQFEVSIDGGTTWTIHGAHQFGSPNFVTVVTANFIASLNMAGKTNFRVRATAAVTGTAAVQVVETVNPSTVYIANSLKLIDSTASATPTGMTIKAGSTAPIASDSAIVVSLSPNSSGSIKVAGSAKANDPTFNTNSGSNITTSAYLQLVASTTSAATAVEIYNQSASSIYFATGAAASEINQFIIPPGGNGRIPFTLAASTRVSVKAVDVTATTGSLIVNYWT